MLKTVENEKYTGKINYVKLLNYNIKGVYKSYGSARRSKISKYKITPII